MRGSKRIGPLVLAGLVAAASAAATAEAKQGAEAKQEAEEPRLPAGARMLLLERMGNHRLDMTRLHAAVLFLEHDAARVLAERIAAEPRIATPAGGAAAELNSLVPPLFFELQDELRAKALQVSKAAAQGDDAAIARAYGSLTETCVRCHAAFLNDKD